MNCNLKCPVCFIYGQEDKLSLQQIKNGISKYKNKIVSISGGEPTLRKDIFKIIRVISKNNIPLLATNGIKMVDKRYVKRLERAGLRHVTFSFNGFSDKVYLKINGVPLLQQKLKAIENLKKTKIKLLLSVLLVKGINEKEIKPIVEYAIKNRNSIREVRIRAMCPIGKYIKQKRILLSEMVNIICKELKIDKEDIYKELQLKKEISNKLPFLEIFQKPCGFAFHLKIKNGKYEPVGKYIKSKNLFTILKYIKNVYGFSGVFTKIIERIGKSKSFWYHKKSILKIVLRCWPTLETLNFHDHIKLCGSRYLIGRKSGLPVCYANILEDIKLHK
jgi:uncharacterized radical SAM superfamily Fe-S cluster-containing enzyme